MVWLLMLVQFILFLLLCLFLFTVPGLWLLKLRATKNSFWDDFALSTTVGFCFVTLLSYFLLLIHLNNLLPIFIFLIDLYVLKNKQIIFSLPNFKPINYLITVIFIIGIVGQLLVIVPSGISQNGNVVFWSAHGHDGVWHLALIQELQKNFPWQNPDFAEKKLVNYHFFSDISIADFSYFFKLPPTNLYFRFFPFLFSILLGFLSFQLGKLLGRSNFAGLWAFIFTFFAGSFGYFLTFWHDQTIGGENLFWSSQIQSVSGNPPQHIAFIITLAVLLLIPRFLETHSKHIGIGLVLLIGILAEFKIYGGVILLIGLMLASIWKLISSKNLSLFIVTILSSVLAATLYLPNTSASEGLLIFQPWWFIRTMVVATDKLNWLDLELRRQTYLAAHSYLRVAQLEIEAFLIFLVGNLGMRILGVWYLVKNCKQLDTLNLLIGTMLLASLILPMLFIQKAIPANTIQFFQYFLLIFGILAGVATANLLSQLRLRALQIGIGIVIVLFAVPTQIGLLKIFYQRPPFAQIPASEISALKLLQQNSKPSDIVLTPPFVKQNFNQVTPPIWLWSDTSYVSAFSSRRVFVADIEQLDIMGYNYQSRLALQKQIFAATDPLQFQTLLKQNHINFLYFPSASKPTIDLNKTNLQNLLRNSQVEIWKIN